jgi:hypothetical protein
MDQSRIDGLLQAHLDGADSKRGQEMGDVILRRKG